MGTMTREQARRFILSKQGLLGKYRFVGKPGAYQYIRQSGCIQYDPVDVCGKNAELTLQSRVRGFTKKMLADLLYKDRLLVDYTDKELLRLASLTATASLSAADAVGGMRPLPELEALEQRFKRKELP